jgi:DnaK suppressor protein
VLKRENAMKRVSDLTAKAAQYREVLLAKKAELLAEVGSQFRRTEQERVAEEDQVPAAHDEFISLQIERLSYCTLKEIDAALDRLATGGYGVCVDCGAAISSRRLAAIPWAMYCVQCQQNMGQSVEKLGARAA